MIEINKQLSSCPRCGGSPVITQYAMMPEVSMEIQCTKCGLTMQYDSEMVYAISGQSIAIGQTVTWSYRDSYKQPIDVWNNGFNFNKKDSMEE